MQPIIAFPFQNAPESLHRAVIDAVRHAGHIAKGRFSFRLTAPYNEERRRAASEAAKKCGVHRKVANLYESIG